VLRHPGVITIPKATQPEHVRAKPEGARRYRSMPKTSPLSTPAFPPPKRASPLEMT